MSVRKKVNKHMCPLILSTSAEEIWQVIVDENSYFDLFVLLIHLLLQSLSYLVTTSILLVLVIT